MPKVTSLVSVIICSYNTKTLTCECLERLKKSINQSGQRVDTIVVENGNDGTGREIKKRYNWVKVLEPKENTGFAKGNNLGIKAANTSTTHYLFINSDTLLETETLTKATKYFFKHQDCDVLGCRLVFANGKMQPSAGYLPTPLNTIMWMLGLDKLPGVKKLSRPVHPKNKDFFQKDRQAGWVMGAFVMMKKEVVQKTGGFDEKFFMYMEEVEWCRRINTAGFRIVYTPEFSVKHLDKSSSGGELEKPLKREVMGLLYYLKKYYPNTGIIMKITIALGMTGRWIGYRIKGDRLRSNIYRDILKDIWRK